MPECVSAWRSTSDLVSFLAAMGCVRAAREHAALLASRHANIPDTTIYARPAYAQWQPGAVRTITGRRCARFFHHADGWDIDAHGSVAQQTFLRTPLLDVPAMPPITIMCVGLADGECAFASGLRVAYEVGL